MPVSWIHQLGKDERVQLAATFGMELNGAEELDQLRRMMKEKWRLIEMLVPSERILGESKTGGQSESGDERREVVKSPETGSKMNSKVLFELVRALPVIKVTDPESVLEFLVKTQGIWKLKLVTDVEFLSIMLSKAHGYFAQVIGKHLTQRSNWVEVRKGLVKIFLPSRVREQLLNSRVLNRFQHMVEDLHTYLLSIREVVETLSYEGTEEELVDRVLQNLHPRIRPYLLFTPKPNTFRELFDLASVVANAGATEKLRQDLLGVSEKREARSGASLLSAGRRSKLRCWNCGE
jgi:hypothetical protein